MSRDLSPRAQPAEADGRIELPASPSSAARARRFVADRAAAWSLPAPVGEQLALVSSELVTNAVLHARTALTLVLELRDDRVRVSVRDGSSSPAAMRHYQTDSLTGRGLGVVAASSRSWGVEASGAGKVVWAELDRAGDRAGPGAMAEPRRRVTPARPPPDGQARPVRFPAVPVQAYLDLQAHNDALFRELELISFHPPGGHDGDQELVALVERLRSQFRGQRDTYRDVVAAAQARGDPTVDLETSAPPTAVPLARTYVELLEQADELCRRGRLLTPPPPAHVSALRRWFVAQMAAQLLGDPPPAAAAGR